MNGGREHFLKRIELNHFGGPKAPAKHLDKLMRAAESLWQQQPWDSPLCDVPIRIEVPALEVDGCLYVAPATDMLMVAFFPHVEDFELSVSAALFPGLTFNYLRVELVEQSQPSTSIIEHQRHGRDAAVGERELDIMIAALTALATSLGSTSRANEARHMCIAPRCRSEGNVLRTHLTVPHPHTEDAPPSYEQPSRADTLHVINPYGLPLDDLELAELESAIGPARIHLAMGVFCAVASLPREVARELWLERVLYGLSTTSAERYQRTLDLLTRCCDFVLATLEWRHTDPFVPTEEDAQACVEWARGYSSLSAAIVRSDLSPLARRSACAIDALSGYLDSYHVLNMIEGVDADVPEPATLRAGLAHDVAYLFDYWFDERMSAAGQGVTLAAPSFMLN